MEERALVQRTSWTRPQSQRSLKQRLVRHQKEQRSALAFHFVAMRYPTALTAATAQTGSERVAGAAEDEDVVGHEEVCVRAAKVESAESAARKRPLKARRVLLAVEASAARANTGNTLRVERRRALQRVERALLAEAEVAGAAEEASAGKEAARDARTARAERVEAGSAADEEDSADLPRVRQCRSRATLDTATNALATSTFRPRWISPS